MACIDLQSLPGELIYSILEFCDSSSILAFMITGSYLFTSGIPALYRDVDLSIHNREPERDTASMYKPVLWADQTPLRSTPPSFLKRQHNFIYSILKRPELAKYVHHFSWTLVFSSDSGRPWPDVLPEMLLEPPETEIWNVFEKMTNVRTLDLASLHVHWIPYAQDCPSKLFSSATSIRLLGWMSYSLATSILHSVTAERLRHLALDDLQDWGQEYDGKPISWFYGHDIRGLQEYSDDSTTRGEVFPGPMRRLLQPLEGKCHQLTSLFLRKAGQEHAFVQDFNEKADEEVYIEWASFVRTVKPTLKSLVFEQAGKQRLSISGTRPMDDRFVTHFLPCILDGQWQCLESLDVRGVNLGDDYAIMVEALANNNVQISNTETTEKPCAKFNGFMHV
ncbi:hypothetical protein MMC09_001742 [Bachmanniomyces sp. S44760]|nr:hypothetical protein [Bachmanniomyces sp. S44760]